MKKQITLLVILMSSICFAQVDFIKIKKNDYNIKTYKYQGYSTETDTFSGNDSINIKLMTLKKDNIRKIIYYQVNYKNYWTTIDSICFNKNKLIKGKRITMPCLINKEIKARLKILGIMKEDLSEIKRIRLK